MTYSLPFTWNRKKPGATLLGLSLEAGRVDAVVLRRHNGHLQVRDSFSSTLTLDPLTNEPELVGREIRNQLDAAGVREKHCAVCIPLSWALTVHLILPKLPEEDVASFLQLEAERAFPCDAETLLMATSRYRSPAGEEEATLAGIPRHHLEALEKALLAAQLKPVSFSLGITALQSPELETSNGVLALALGDAVLGVQITCGGGIAALRTLEATHEMEGGVKELDPDLVAREIRITLGQLPDAERELIRRVRVFGPREAARMLCGELQSPLGLRGMQVEAVERYTPGELGPEITPADTPVSPALSLAAGYLSGRRPVLEFLPPKVSQWQLMAARYSSKKLRLAGAAAAILVLILALLWGVQQWQLSHLRSQWTAMAPQVQDLEHEQDYIKRFRAWYDPSPHCLNILRQLTEAFPEDGVVSAKQLEIRDLSAVTCSGVARDNTALLKTLERLGAAPQVADLQTPQIQGNSPIQFTFNFHWGEGGGE